MKNAYQTKRTPPSPLPHTSPPPMNLLEHILFKLSPWVTRHFPGWFKWGFKEYWKVRYSQMTIVCWDSQTHKLHTKRITPLSYTGTGGNFFLPHFFYLSQNGVSKRSELTPFCSDKWAKTSLQTAMFWAKKK